MSINSVGPVNKPQRWGFAQSLLAFGGLALVLSLGVLTRPPSTSSEGKEEVPEVLTAAKPVSDEPLDVVFSDSILSLPSYVHKNKRGALAGKVIDLWQCVFNRAGVQAQYRLLPNRRSMQELLGGGADFHGGRVAPSQGDKAFEEQLYYTDSVVPVYEVLLVRAADKPTLTDELWWRRRVGVIRGETVIPHVAAVGGEVAIRAVNRDQALKLLVGKRVDVLLYISARAGELITSYQGHELAGRTLSRLNGHGLLSAKRHRQSPSLLARINLSIASCKPLRVPPSR